MGRVSMRTVVGSAWILVLMVFLLPLLLLCGADGDGGAMGPPAATLPPQPTAELAQDRAKIKVALEGGTVETMPLGDYLFRVVAAEMPATFGEEALKAQAVAARTYALRKQKMGEQNHPEADVCSDITCCQAYLDPGQAAAAWGDRGEEYREKIARAVGETDGVVATYQGELIQAVFFSSTAEKTNDAVAVWGSAVPYLQSVDSGEGASDVPGYLTQVPLTPEAFRALFLGTYPSAVLEGDPGGWFQNPVLAKNGSVSSITVGGVAVSGVALRGLCGLRSAHFTVEATPEQITFSVTAYGHGVGMSQYGANVMAQNGADYREILEHYYTGVTVGEAQ